MSSALLAILCYEREDGDTAAKTHVRWENEDAVDYDGDADGFWWPENGEERI